VTVDGVDCVNLTQNRDRWWAVVNKVFIPKRFGGWGGGGLSDCYLVNRSMLYAVGEAFCVHSTANNKGSLVSLPWVFVILELSHMFLNKSWRQRNVVSSLKMSQDFNVTLNSGR
jgi:hypothetical protein